MNETGEVGDEMFPDIKLGGLCVLAASALQDVLADLGTGRITAEMYEQASGMLSVLSRQFALRATTGQRKAVSRP
jgi:hypothetical protein